MKTYVGTIRSREKKKSYIIGDSHLNRIRKDKFKEGAPNARVYEKSFSLKFRSDGVSSIAVSSILKRNSFNINQVTYQVNNIFKRLCRINDFFYLCNDLVNESYLWKDGFHLTNEGPLSC